MNAPRGADRTVARFQLQPGELYRISYVLGSPQLRRVTRSLAVFGGESVRRQWDGSSVPCLDFTRPQGRPLSLLSAQLVDARLASLNDSGHVILLEHPQRGRRRLARRSVPRVA